MSEFNAADYGIDWPTTPREIVTEALREFVGDGEGVDGAVFAAFVDEVRAPLEAALQRIRDLHPKIEDPRHGCCAAPKLCEGHGPECWGLEHPLGGVPWPCATLRAIEEER